MNNTITDYLPKDWQVGQRVAFDPNKLTMTTPSIQSLLKGGYATPYYSGTTPTGIQFTKPATSLYQQSYGLNLPPLLDPATQQYYEQISPTKAGGALPFPSFSTAPEAGKVYIPELFDKLTTAMPSPATPPSPVTSPWNVFSALTPTTTAPTPSPYEALKTPFEEMYGTYRTALEERKKQAREQTETQYGQLLSQVGEAGKQAMGTTKAMLARIGGFDTTTGAQYLTEQTQETQRRQRDVEIAKEQALRSIDQAYEAQDFAAISDLSNQMFSIAQEEQKITQASLDNRLKELGMNLDAFKAMSSYMINWENLQSQTALKSNELKYEQNNIAMKLAFDYAKLAQDAQQFGVEYAFKEAQLMGYTFDAEGNMIPTEEMRHNMEQEAINWARAIKPSAPTTSVPAGYSMDDFIKELQGGMIEIPQTGPITPTAPSPTNNPLAF